MFLDYNFRNYNYRLFLYVLLLNITGVLIIRSASNQDASMVMETDRGHSGWPYGQSLSYPCRLPQSGFFCAGYLWCQPGFSSGCAGIRRKQRRGKALAGTSGHRTDPAIRVCKDRPDCLLLPGIFPDTRSE